MSTIKRRIEQAEQALSMDRGPLPEEERRGNVTIRHVSYESIRERLEGGAGHED